MCIDRACVSSVVHAGSDVCRVPNVVMAMPPQPSPQGGAFRSDHRHELVPRRRERLRALVLQTGREGIDVDACPGELAEDGLAVAAVGRHEVTELRVGGQRLQRALRHRVHGERRGELLHVEDVGRLRVLGPRAGPEQPLRMGPEVVQPLPPGRREQRPCRRVRALRHRDPEPVLERLGNLGGHRRVPAADEDRRDRADVRVEADVDPPLDARGGTRRPRRGSARARRGA